MCPACFNDTFKIDECHPSPVLPFSLLFFLPSLEQSVPYGSCICLQRYLMLLFILNKCFPVLFHVYKKMFQYWNAVGSFVFFIHSSFYHVFFLFNILEYSSLLTGYLIPTTNKLVIFLQQLFILIFPVITSARTFSLINNGWKMVIIFPDFKGIPQGTLYSYM